MPSKRHIQLQNMVWTWIRNRSIKIHALPECSAVGYSADFVALSRMLDSEHTKYCKYSGLEKKTMSKVWQGVGLPMKHLIKGEIDRHYICVFEVKVSRADFLKTFGGKTNPHAKARMKPVGTAHWVVAGKGVCRPEELPDFWGLLEPFGSGLAEKKTPILNVLSEAEIHSIFFDMMWLSMNYRTSYYEQLAAMSTAIEKTQKAIATGKPIAEIHRLCNKAVEMCRGMV